MSPLYRLGVCESAAVLLAACVREPLGLAVIMESVGQKMILTQRRGSS